MRLYYADSYLRTFPATIVEVSEVSGKPVVVLDRTAFYPTSGGQPHDTGRLGTAGVVEVQVREADQQIIHLLDAPLGPGPVQGEIDWARRFDHMQQHTGQHVLSQAFLRVASAETIGFHLGAESVSIDLATTSLSDRQISEAEELANEIVTGSLPVRAWFPDPAELGELPLRKPPDVAGPVRLVAIGDFDLSPCGGTHVAATGEIGLIAVLKSERLKRGTRIDFRSGHRARTDYARKHAVVRELAAALTCSPGELPEALTRTREALSEARRRLAQYRERELDAEAAALLHHTAPGPPRIVRAAFPNRPVEDLRELALRLTGTPEVIALLGSAGERCALVFARSENLGTDLGPAFRQSLEALGGGRGGGTRVQQGSAGAADLPRLEKVLGEAAAGLGRGGS